MAFNSFLMCSVKVVTEFEVTLLLFRLIGVGNLGGGPIISY